MEKFIYETRPYFFSVMGLFSMAQAENSMLRLICGAILLAAGGFVIRQRYLNRANIRYF